MFSVAYALKKARLKKEITTLETAVFIKTVFKHLLSQNCAIGEQDTVCTPIQVFAFSLNAQKAPDKTSSCRVRPAQRRLWLNSKIVSRFIKTGLPRGSDSLVKPRFAESHQHKGISQTPRPKPAGLSRRWRKRGRGRGCSRKAPCVLRQTLSGGRAGGRCAGAARGSQMRGLALTPAAELFL